MRNLKKILALVLAMVMTFSVMATANAFSDDAAINADYEEAIDVLAAMGIFEGYENGSFQPKGAITRAEVAAIIYRIATTDVKDLQVKLYSDYNKFDDVKSTSWYAGYVNYCANAEYIRGYNDTTFGPQDNVTGYQVLAMILRAVGYDQNGEWAGKGWEIKVASTAKMLGITDSLTGIALGQPATREVVAEILFKTLLLADIKVWTPALGYYLSQKDAQGNVETLGSKNFDLDYAGSTTDEWGRPGDAWTFNVKSGYLFRQDKPLYTFYNEMTECDLSHALGRNLPTNFVIHANGDKDWSAVEVNPTDRVSTVGAQGRAIEVYETGAVDTLVAIDTYYAEVDKVVDRTFDLAGHVRTAATMDVTVYHATGTLKYTFESYTEDYNYETGDDLAVNWNLGEFAKTNSYFEVVSELAPATVTISAITKDGKGNDVGFIANGTRYAYNCTFYTAGFGKLATTDISKTFKVWTDARGNVLALEEVGTAAATGYGVITALDVERVALGKHVVVANVLAADGTTVTVKIGDVNEKYFVDEDDADKYATAMGLDHLITYVDADNDGVYTWTKGASVVDNAVDCGEYNAVNGNVVNDNTVFYIANYTYSNAKQEYVFTNYSIVKGFKNIMDLTVDGLKFTALDIEVLGGKNAVLVKNANKQIVPEKVDVLNYAFLMTDGQFVDIADDSYTYSAIVNGTAGQKLVVSTAASVNANVTKTGLYTYTKETHNTVDNVLVSANTANASTYSVPKAGLMTVENGAKYLTVADNCQYFIINPTTGASVGATVSAMELYKNESAIAYQFDANGYVSLIYIVETVNYLPY